jgi:hypothetical protein
MDAGPQRVPLGGGDTFMQGGRCHDETMARREHEEGLRSLCDEVTCKLSLVMALIWRRALGRDCLYSCT